jgi:hypothetical protein
MTWAVATHRHRDEGLFPMDHEDQPFLCHVACTSVIADAVERCRLPLSTMELASQQIAKSMEGCRPPLAMMESVSQQFAKTMEGCQLPLTMMGSVSQQIAKSMEGCRPPLTMMESVSQQFAKTMEGCRPRLTMMESVSEQMARSIASVSPITEMFAKLTTPTSDITALAEQIRLNSPGAIIEEMFQKLRLDSPTVRLAELFDTARFSVPTRGMLDVVQSARFRLPDMGGLLPRGLFTSGDAAQVGAVAWEGAAPSAAVWHQAGDVVPGPRKQLQIRVRVRCMICSSVLLSADREVTWLSPSDVDVKIAVFPLCCSCTRRAAEDPDYLVRQLEEIVVPPLTLLPGEGQGDGKPTGPLRLVEDPDSDK